MREIKVMELQPWQERIMEILSKYDSKLVVYPRKQGSKINLQILDCLIKAQEPCGK